MAGFDPFADNATSKDKMTDTLTADTAPGTEVSVTLKGGVGYDAPWVVMRAPDIASASEMVADTEALKPLLDGTHKAGTYFAGLSKKAAPGASEPSAPAAERTPPQKQAPGGEERFCKHSDDFGAMTFRTGVAKSGPNAGKVWKAFMCPSPQGTADQCKPQYLR